MSAPHIHGDGLKSFSDLRRSVSQEEIDARKAAWASDRVITNPDDQLARNECAFDLWTAQERARRAGRAA